MNITAIGTHLKVANFERSKKFYLDLGFNPIFEYGPELGFEKDSSGNLITASEEYHGIVFEHGGCKLEIADGHRAVKPETFSENISSSKVSLMINVDSIASLIDRCKKADIALEVEPRHFYWGTIEAVLKDPDGFILVFICPHTPEEATLVKPDETWATPPGK